MCIRDRDIGMFDSLYEKNLNYFKQLQIYITAGEEKIAELREKTIPSLRAEAQKSGDPMHAQVVRDFEETVTQFEKKVHDLKTSKTIALQTAPQIRLIPVSYTHLDVYKRHGQQYQKNPETRERAPEYHDPHVFFPCLYHHQRAGRERQRRIYKAEGH